MCFSFLTNRPGCRDTKEAPGPERDHGHGTTGCLPVGKCLLGTAWRRSEQDKEVGPPAHHLLGSVAHVVPSQRSLTPSPRLWVYQSGTGTPLAASTPSTLGYCTPPGHAAYASWSQRRQVPQASRITVKEVDRVADVVVVFGDEVLGAVGLLLAGNHVSRL
jgi:hypothetical protein